MPTINSLGIGSGVLTADILEQLREADDSTIIKPLENKITLANQKEDAYALLESLMTTFKSGVSALDGDNLYLGRAVTGNTDAVTVIVEDGSNVQNFNITDIDKAEKDVWNSGTTFTSKDEAISGLGSGTFSISIEGTTNPFEIAYTSASTLEDIKEAINEEAGAQMTASILEVGEGEYELILTAKETNKAITFSDSNTQVDTVTLADATLADGDEFSLTIDGFTVNYVADVTGGDDIDAVNNALKALMDAHDFGSGAGNDFAISQSEGGALTITALNPETIFTSSAAVVNDPSGTATIGSTSVAGNPAGSLATALNLNNIQPAEAATFKYNGIEISRSTNEIDDLITGVTITLNENQEAADTATIDIAQNSTAISSEMALFVNSYNALITNLQDLTSSDRESGAVGIFNGDSFIKSISREITNIITAVNTNGNSLIDYGIDIDRDGVMSLDNDVFAQKFVTDPEGMELFFSGDADTNGVFTRLNTQMTSYLGYQQLMSNFSDQLDESKELLTEQYDRQKAMLDDRYEIMQKRFIAYDAIISRINSEFSSLQMMIDAEANADS